MDGGAGTWKSACGSYVRSRSDRVDKHTTDEALLRVEELRVGFATSGGFVRAVDGVSFEIRRGEVLGLVGESGCGKTVTALSVLRLLARPPAVIEGGRAWFGGRDLLAMPIEELRRIRGGRIGMIFQEPMTALSPLHRIGDQLVEALRLHRSMGVDEAWALGLDWLRRVGLPDAEQRMKDWPHQLSGGMRQRAMLAMALAPEPELLVADEPTTALDVTIQAQIFELLQEVRGGDTAVLLITHDMGVVWDVCDRVQVMYAGRTAETGSRDAVFDRPLHPYTRGLLGAMPRLHGRVGRLPDIPGQLPALANPPPGCRFAPRCALAQDVCRERAPDLREIEPGHEVACWMAGKEVCRG
jgi:oligopeptide/dipeptide ABC transporter ATP-binding protein